jgi:hypothetical protein
VRNLVGLRPPNMTAGDDIPMSDVNFRCPRAAQSLPCGVFQPRSGSMRHQFRNRYAGFFMLCAGCSDPTSDTTTSDAAVEQLDGAASTTGGPDVSGLESDAGSTSGGVGGPGPDAGETTAGVGSSGAGDHGSSSTRGFTSSASSSNEESSSGMTDGDSSTLGSTTSLDEAGFPTEAGTAETSVPGLEDGGAMGEAGSMRDASDQSDGGRFGGPVCGFPLDAENAVSLEDVLPRLSEVDAGSVDAGSVDAGSVDAGNEGPCYPPCIMALLDACRPAGACENTTSDVSCWDNGVGQRRETTIGGDIETTTDTVFLNGAPCMTGSAEFDLITYGSFYKWWDGQGNLVATAEYTDESVAFVVTCEGGAETFISDRSSSSCSMLGASVFQGCSD